MYDLIVAATLGGIAVLLAGTYAGLWVMRRRWLDTQRQLQQEREERLRAVSELRVAVARTEYEKQLALLDGGDDDNESPEERRKRFRIVPPPLAIPIALLLGAGAWLRAHLWAPARAHPWTTAGSIGIAAAIATAVYVAPGDGSSHRTAEPPITTAPTAPGPRESTPPPGTDAERTPSDSPPPVRAVTAGRRGSPFPSPSGTAPPPAPEPAAGTSPPPSGSATAGGTTGTSSGGSSSGGATDGGSDTAGASGGTDGGTTTGGTDGGTGTTPPADPDPPDDDRDSLLCLDVDLPPILQIGLCLL